VKLKVSIIGLGYLGATTAVAFAKLGHDVIGIDSDANKLATLKSGRVPFYEPGLDDALSEAFAQGNLKFQTSQDSNSGAADIHLLCVGTPQSKTGLGADTSYLFSAVADLAPYLSEDSVVAGKSTVPVGTAKALRAHLSNLVDFEPHVAWNPEFLREGTALQDTLVPDRIVIGTDEMWSEKILRTLYKPITDAGVPLLQMDIPTAELVKVAANSFLATKISFINAMAEVAEVSGADAVKLAEAIGYDERIGNKFLKTGIGFGGGCLPKDIRAFSARAEELGVGKAVGFLREVEEINLRRRSRVIELAQDELGDLSGKRVVMLGAAFKPETDDVRDSPAMAVAEQFWSVGAHVIVHDPKALENVQRMYPQLDTEYDLAAALDGAELVVLATEWKDYREADPQVLGALVRNRLVIDGRNALDVAAWRDANWQVIALGRKLERLPAVV
jgi:UDPglucose 6-dehydrogenase